VPVKPAHEEALLPTVRNSEVSSPIKSDLNKSSQQPFEIVVEQQVPVPEEQAEPVQDPTPRDARFFSPIIPRKHESDLFVLPQQAPLQQSEESEPGPSSDTQSEENKDLRLHYRPDRDHYSVSHHNSKDECDHYSMRPVQPSLVPRDE